MSLGHDLVATGDRLSAWLDRVATSTREWAASDSGQQVLRGVDFLTLSTRVGEYYQHAGWYLPVHPALYRHALERVEIHAPFDPREIVRLVGPGSSHWPWITEGALLSPSLADRRDVVEDAVFCLENGRWHAAVSTLLPVIEGVVSDRAGIFEGMRVGRRVEHLLHTDAGHWETLSVVPALTVLDAEIFDRREFAGVSLDDEALNRHLVLHGRTARFGNDINALRTFLLLVAAVEALDGAVMFRAGSVPSDDGDLLDQFGPLAVVRKAAIERAARPVIRSNP